MSEKQKSDTKPESVPDVEEDSIQPDTNQDADGDKSSVEPESDEDHTGGKSEDNKDADIAGTPDADIEESSSSCGGLDTKEENLAFALSSWLRSPLDYEGRTARKPFWLVMGFLTFVHVVVLVPLIYYSSIPSPGPNFDRTMLVSWALFFLARIVMHFFTIPLIVRRIRDAGFSPYLTFVILIPIMGLGLLLLAAQPSAAAEDTTDDKVDAQ